MKIAMIGQKGIPSRAGGVEIHVEELAAGLVKMGASVDVYCRRYYCKKRVRSYRGIRLFYIPTIPTKYFDAIIYTFLATIVALFRGYDIFHYHACGPSSLCWIPKLFGKRVVCTTHGMDWMRAKWSAIGKDYLKFGEKMIAKCADEVIVLNNPMKDYFKEIYHRKTNIVPNGVEEPTLYNADQIKKKWGIEKEDYILYLGRLVPEKGIHYLIEAYRNIKTDKKLVIAGGSSHSDDYVERLAAMSFDNDNIIMTGFVTGRILEELYSNAYLYVLPSDVEGLPISLLEAMSYERCCLVSDIKENTTTGGGNVYEFVHGNVQNLQMVLEQVLRKTEDEIHEMGRSAKNYVLDTYQWKSITQKTYNVYQKVIKGHIYEVMETASKLRKQEVKTLYDIELPMDICPILGVNIVVTDMNKTCTFVEQNIHKLSGEYVCVSNGHTTVTAHDEPDYLSIQNGAILALPDGEPLSIVSRKRGYKEARRVTGPDFMEHMFIRGNEGNGLRHFFYGATEDTLAALEKKLRMKYPDLQIVGMYSPPFRPLSDEEDREVVDMINAAKADIVWVGLGAPKQERWMASHHGRVQGLMFGVGAGFDYHAGKLKRAPIWVQKLSMEWVVRLLQDPKRLWKRYLVTNIKFIWYTWREGRRMRTWKSMIR